MVVNNMKAYKFNLKLQIKGTLSSVFTEISISSIGENEEEAFKNLKDSLEIINIANMGSARII